VVSEPYHGRVPEPRSETKMKEDNLWA